MKNRKKREQQKPDVTNKSVTVDAGVLQDPTPASQYSDIATQRISWIDNAKALGIIAVFYGHIIEKIFLTYNIPAAGFQYKLIYSFHMPLFFLLSGYLVKETQSRKFSVFMKNKFMTRIVPFFFFNILILPCYFISLKISHQSIDVGQFFQQSLNLLYGRAAFNFITWFLACLFSVEVINYLLYPILRRNRIVLCCAMVLFYIMGWSFSYKADIINQYITIPDFWFIHEALVAYSFYLSGNLIASFPIFHKKINPYLSVLLFLLTAVCVLVTFNMNYGPFFSTYTVVMFAFGGYGSFLLFPLTAIAGSMCIISASRLMPSISFMSFLGRNTLPLMGLNGILTLFANIIFINYSMIYFSENHLSVFMQCVSLTCITLLLCVPFVILLNRYVPFMIGYRKDISKLSSTISNDAIKTFASVNKFKIVMTLLLVAAVIAVYIQVRDFSFISFDDDIYVYNCPQVQEGFTLQNVIWCFKSIHANNWHPLTSISLFLDSTFFGINPTAYHLENMFFHIVNSILLLLVLSLMTGFFWRSLFVAALFALHPLHVESVAWVSERKDVLCTMFWMFTLLSYWWYTKSPKVKRYSLVLLSMVLGLLAKPMLVTLPFVLLLLDYWPLRRFQDSDIFKGRFLNILWDKMPLFLVVTIFSVITFMVQNYSGMVKPTESFRIDVRISNAIVSYVAYLGSMIWPIKLAILYPQPLQILLINTLFAGLLLLSITFIALKFIRKVPYLTIGWFWYLGTLVPVIGFIQVGLQAKADRYTYIPLIGIFIIIAWGIPDLLTKFRYKVPVLVVSAAAILIVYAVTTYYQVGYWRNSESIYNHTLNVTENNFIIHAMLAEFLENDHIDEAIKHYRESIRIKPDYLEAHMNLGKNLLISGDIEGSKDQFNWVLSQHYHYYDANAHMGLGIALSKQGRIEEAIKHYLMAMQIKPTLPVKSYLEKALSDKKTIESTIQTLEDQLMITPGNMSILYKLTVLYSSVGQEDKSISHLLSMSRIQPDNPDIYYNLACIY